MVALDYLVATWPEISTIQSCEPELRKIVRVPERGHRYGYHGIQGIQSFFGYNQFLRRYMIILTGGYASEAAPKIPLYLDLYVSIARLDIQSTFRVDRADKFIESLNRSKIYKATRIVPVEGFGQTLYVGSRSSNLFCRVYNKSAESNLPPDKDGEFVRVEFCLRDSYADSAWKQYRLKNIDAVFSYLVQRMFEESSALDILQFSRNKLCERDLELLRADVPDWRERRLAWIESVVVPAINKLIADAPWTLGRIWDALDEIPKPGYNRE